MPDSGIADGATFSSAFWDAYVREQVCATCTSATHPTNVEGRLIYETNTDRWLGGTGTGSNWITLAEPPQTWTPTVSGLTVGNGTWAAYHLRSNGLVEGWGTFTFGSTSAVTAALIVTIPYTLASDARIMGMASFEDASPAGQYMGTVDVWSTTSILLSPIDASGTYAKRATASATVPYTWATSDKIKFHFKAPMANRYD